MNMKSENEQYIAILENMCNYCNYCKPSTGHFAETMLILQAVSSSHYKARMP